MSWGRDSFYEERAKKALERERQWYENEKYNLECKGSLGGVPTKVDNAYKNGTIFSNSNPRHFIPPPDLTRVETNNFGFDVDREYLVPNKVLSFESLFEESIRQEVLEIIETSDSISKYDNNVFITKRVFSASEYWSNDIQYKAYFPNNGDKMEITKRVGMGKIIELEEHENKALFKLMTTIYTYCSSLVFLDIEERASNQRYNPHYKGNKYLTPEIFLDFITGKDTTYRYIQSEL